jgi:uncharacterized protein (DUF1015 family)
MLYPFSAAYYSSKSRSKLAQLITSDLDTAEHLWGPADSSKAFRNVLVGPPEQRGEIWQAWISSGTVDLSDDESFYVLHQVQRVEGRLIDRWALYATVDVNDSSLFIHEDVQSEGVERARQGMEACEGDMAPIFVGCEEGVGASLRDLLSVYCAGRKPVLQFESQDKGMHNVWAVSDPSLEARIRQLFEGTPLFLLDGHHRLAAARENHKLHIGDGRILACVCSMARTDTLILPIHRAVRYPRWMLPEVMQADLVRAGCKVAELPELRVNEISAYLEANPSAHPYCIVQHSHSAKPVMVELPVNKQSGALAALAVACLDFGVMGDYAEATVIPVPGLDLALEQLALDQAQAVFFLAPASPAQVRAIALARLMMPRKSTRFTPKPALGLLMRPWTANL